MSQMPDFVQLDISQRDYFSFLIPVTAFGFNDTMIIEISVDYGLSEDKAQCVGNVWGRQARGTTKLFLCPVSIPACDDPETAIIEALNKDKHFSEVMMDCICLIAKSRCD